MQDRYAGDVGDFGKYGLLMALCAEELTWDSRSYDLSLGVVWYLDPDEEGTGDGGHVGYLEPTPQNLRRFRDCDPPLYDTLGEVVRSGRRSVRAVRECGVLPEGTAYYEEVLSFAGMPVAGAAAREERLDHRRAWVQGALETVDGCDVVYVDPDNGLEIERVRRHFNKGPKYAYFDELVPYLERGQSLVIYHHLHLGTTRRAQVQEERLPQVIERLGKAFALVYRPGSGRAFFVVPSESRWSVLYERAVRLVEHPCWSQHFTLYGPEGPE